MRTPADDARAVAPLAAVLCAAPSPPAAVAEAVGEEAATALGLALLLDLLDAIAPLGDRDLVVGADGMLAPLRALLPPGVGASVDAPGTPGERIGRLAARRLLDGRPAIAIVRADRPADGPEIAAAAEEALDALADGADAAVCPWGDRGDYALIAMARHRPVLFEDIPWGSTEVLAVTRSRARAAGLTLAEPAPVRALASPADLIALGERLDGAGEPCASPRSRHAIARLLCEGL